MGTTLFNNKFECDIIQIYVDDILFGSTNTSLCKKFSMMMSQDFEMSSIEELTYFLGLLLNKVKKETFLVDPSTLKNLSKNLDFKITIASIPHESLLTIR